MNRRTFSWGLVASSMLLAVPTWAQDSKPATPTVEDLLALLDKNLTFETRKSRIKMTVEGKGRTREYEIVGWGRGQADSAMEYVAPRREKGTRMLKIGDELWIYMPAVERVQKISGHMLRQGMMGSDISYEDMMAAETWRDRYSGAVTGEGTHDGRPCWLLDMKAKDNTVSYPRRKIWVDQETYIPVKQELYALSGKLLKTWTMSNIKTFGDGRKYPQVMEIADAAKKGSVTRIEMLELEFGVTVGNEVFAKRWLERGK